MMRQIDWPSLFVAASQVQERAHAPYSNFKVGAALLARSGEVFAGCNVENASYGLTICAERAAVATAVAAGQNEFVALAVVGGSGPIAPCGACRQVLAEFGDSVVIRSRGEGATELSWLLSELLPQPFSDLRGA
jgi:cytidine deaminase